MRRTAAVGAALTVLCALIYAPALRDGFIADDFVNLDFVRRQTGSWWRFLSPLGAFSDPVTRSRYKPLYVYYFRAVDLVFGDRPGAWHALSLAWHGLVAALVYALARRLGGARASSALAALLFATSRIHGQMVVWASANYRLLSVALSLGALLALDLRRSPALACATLFATALAMNPETVALLPALAALAWLRRDRPPEARTALRALAACAPVAVAFAVANRVSMTRFPDLPIARVPDPARVMLFYANLALPFDAPLAAKVAVAAALTAALMALRDGAVRAMLAATLGCALFYALLGYPLAPRYLYLASAFWCVALARGLHAALSRVHPAAPWAVAAPFVVASVVALREPDLAGLHHLGALGARLMDVRREALAHRRVIAVHITEGGSLDAGNLAFFRDTLRFVPRAAAERVVESGYPAFRARYGPRVDEDYWFLPWFHWRVRW